MKVGRLDVMKPGKKHSGSCQTTEIVSEVCVFTCLKSLYCYVHFSSFVVKLAYTKVYTKRLDKRKVFIHAGGFCDYESVLLGTSFKNPESLNKNMHCWTGVNKDFCRLIEK